MQAIVDETQGLRGSWVDQYLAVTLGMLGTAHFGAGRVDDALEPTQRALQICESTGDDEGQAAYLTNLHEIQRYRGEAGAAAGLADRLEQTLASADRARARRYLDAASSCVRVSLRCASSSSLGQRSPRWSSTSSTNWDRSRRIWSSPSSATA